MNIVQRLEEERGMTRSGRLVHLILDSPSTYYDTFNNSENLNRHQVQVEHWQLCHGSESSDGVGINMWQIIKLSSTTGSA